jgi:hypothetical protein
MQEPAAKYLVSAGRYVDTIKYLHKAEKVYNYVRTGNTRTLMRKAKDVYRRKVPSWIRGAVRQNARRTINSYGRWRF